MSEIDNFLNPHKILSATQGDPDKIFLECICWYGKRFSMYLWKKTDWRLAGCVWHAESFKWGHSQKWTGQNTFLQANKTMNRWSHEQNQNFYTHRSNACSGTDSREVIGTKESLSRMNYGLRLLEGRQSWLHRKKLCSINYCFGSVVSPNINM